jgi:hypothetical protein
MGLPERVLVSDLPARLSPWKGARAARNYETYLIHLMPHMPMHRLRLHSITILPASYLIRFLPGTTLVHLANKALE